MGYISFIMYGLMVHSKNLYEEMLCISSMYLIAEGIDLKEIIK